jgi:hypothetical protein
LKTQKLDEWKMNLLVVSEAYKYLIVVVEARLHVYQFDFHKIKYAQALRSKPKIVVDL